MCRTLERRPFILDHDSRVFSLDMRAPPRLDIGIMEGQRAAVAERWLERPPWEQNIVAF
jgi:hypothetical protein